MMLYEHKPAQASWDLWYFPPSWGEFSIVSFSNPIYSYFPRGPVLCSMPCVSFSCLFSQTSFHLLLTTILMMLSSPPIYSWGNRGSERLSDLPKVTQLTSNKVGIWPRSESQSTHLCCLLIRFLVRNILQPNWYDLSILSLDKNGTSLKSQRVK